MLILLCIVGINLSHAKIDIDELMKSAVGVWSKKILQPGMVLAVFGSVSVKKLNGLRWETVLLSQKTAMSL